MVSIAEKQHYGTDARVVGEVLRVLTSAAQHSRGFKVMLTNGVVGRVMELVEVRDQGPGRTGESVAVDPAELDEDSSDAYLAGLDLVMPPPGIRLRDLDTPSRAN